MLENDSFTISVKKKPVNQNTAALTLISQERTQKLELLIHLLTNLPQPLVVCGPEGIGKTTLLKLLKERENQSWLYCHLQGNAGLSFEVLQEQLAQSGLNGLQASTNRKCVLIIDDAGTLVPGLITTIVQYASAHPVLRVVFVLTHDELHVQSKSDRVLDDCHVIEIPPLSEKQCGEFLLALSSQPWTPVSFDAINEHLITTVYRETHGIPGKIIEQIPVLSNVQQSNQGKWWMVVAVAALVSTVLAVQYLNPTNTENKSLPAPVVEQPVASIPPVQPVTPQTELPPLTAKVEEPLLDELISPPEPMVTVDIESQNSRQIVENKTEPLLTPPVADTRKDSIESAKPIPKETVPVVKKALEVPEHQDKKPEVEKVLPVTGDYTLQLMVLSKQSSIDDIQNKYPALRAGFRVTKSIVGGQEKFVLFYGSFDSAATANKARQTLPPEFRNALARKSGAR
ncbi:MAG: hypothetical protein PHC94_01670 [Methylobacter sp.]|nr:hypothetical protein [Methylococcales bacterium]MDD5112698.1 hypothetical protein [Methylobacter sp.]